MLRLRLDLPTLLWLLAVALLSAGAGYRLRSAGDGGGAPPADSIPALVAHLEQRGIHLRVIPLAHDGDVCQGAFLTRTSSDWKELSFWLRNPQQLSHWRGTVHVQPEHSARAREVALASWGEACMVYGQLILFGDPDLLAEIRAAVEHFSPRSRASGPPSPGGRRHGRAGRCARLPLPAPCG
jgi:hypothetical protein